MDKKRSHSDAAATADLSGTSEPNVRDCQSFDPILRPAEVSGDYKVSESTLAKRRMRGEPPEFIKLGPRLVGYRRSACEKWVEACRRSSTSDSGGAD